MRPSLFQFPPARGIQGDVVGEGDVGVDLAGGGDVGLPSAGEVIDALAFGGDVDGVAFDLIGVADREGYSPQALAERKPGIIYVSVKLNTHEGPWTNWPGYDVNAGGIAGLYTQEGTSDQPLLPQLQPLIQQIDRQEQQP